MFGSDYQTIFYRTFFTWLKLHYKQRRNSLKLIISWMQVLHSARLVPCSSRPRRHMRVPMSSSLSLRGNPCSYSWNGRYQGSFVVVLPEASSWSLVVTYTSTCCVDVRVVALDLLVWTLVWQSRLHAEKACGCGLAVRVSWHVRGVSMPHHVVVKSDLQRRCLFSDDDTGWGLATAARRRLHAFSSARFIAWVGAV